MPTRVKKPRVAKAPRFRSGFERSIAEDLEARGIKFEYEERKIPFVQPAKKRTYLTDFTFPNGVVVESKGRLTRLEREKLLLIKQSNPDLDLRLLFMRDNKLSRTSRKKYSDWANEHGIPCAIGTTVPEGWLL
jgi:hypothetical protein